MYWFHTDETNVDPNQGTFFIYGGLMMSADQMHQAHRAVQEVRSKFGFADNDQFKFNIKSRPKDMDQDNWRNAKAEVLRRAVGIGIDMMAYVVHHKIAEKQPQEKRMEWAINAVVTKFDMGYLREKDDVGVVCVDRLDPTFGYDYLRRRFQEPLDLPDGRSPALDRILHYSMSCDGASHISSLVDIALGAFRFCANVATGNGRNVSVAKQIFPSVSRLMWGIWKDGVQQIGGYGYLAFPKEVRKAEYKDDYSKLAKALKEYSQ